MLDVATGVSRALASFDNGSVVRVRAYSSASSTPEWTYDFPAGGAHDVALIDADGDGLLDVFSGRYLGQDTLRINDLDRRSCARCRG